MAENQATKLEFDTDERNLVIVYHSKASYKFIQIFQCFPDHLLTKSSVIPKKKDKNLGQNHAFCHPLSPQ